MEVSLSKAALLLQSGRVVGVPTETVYGLAAALNQPDAIEQIFTLKGRPANNPLIIHVHEAEHILKFTDQLPPQFMELAQRFWPGPLTIVVSVDPERVSSKVRAGLMTAAFRVPAHPLTQELLKLVGPLVMPSANLSGRPSATCLKHVETDFGKDFPVLDGGSCSKGLESTILCYRDEKWRVIRLGAIPAEAFAVVLGYVPEFISAKAGEAPLCPGQLFRHYAPRAILHLCNRSHNCQGVVVGFSDRVYPQAKKVYAMGSGYSAHEVAENLYKTLRDLDADGVQEAYVDMEFPRDELWMTVAERLSKAAQKS